MNIREDPDLIAVSIRLARPRGSTEAKENLARLSARLSCSHAPSTSPTDDRMIGLFNRGVLLVRPIVLLARRRVMGNVRKIVKVNTREREGNDDDND